VGQRPPEGPAVTNLRVGDRLGGLAQQERMRCHHGGPSHVVVRRHGADHDGVAILADPAQGLDPAQIDDDLRCGQAQPEDRDKALATRQYLDVAGRTEQPQRLLEARRGMVVKACRDHCAPSLIEAAWSARHTLCGAQGMATSCTPRCLMASRTPLTMAGVEAIVPASPTPLTPRSFVVDADTVRSVMNDGRSAALGTR